MHQETIVISSRGREITDITNLVSAVVKRANLQQGLCNVFIKHTSASLIICENADPDVRRDLEAFMARLIPDGDPLYIHRAEGNDDMPAHIRSVLTNSSLVIPIQNYRLALGTWQGIFLWEHRYKNLQREIIITISS